MAKRQISLRNIQVVVRPSTRKLKIILILLILASLVTLATIGVVYRHIESRAQAALDQAAELEHENAELTDRIGSIDSASTIRDIAREELGLVDPNTVILNPNSQ